MLVQSLTTALLALLASQVAQTLAAPAAEPDWIPHCTGEKYNYESVKASKPWNKPPQLAGGYRCTSDDVDTCNLGSTISFSQGITKSISGGLSANVLAIGDIFKLTTSLTVGYSWSQTTATGESAGVSCPAGKLTCGIQVVASVVTITGKRCSQGIGYQCPKDTCDNFQIEAPELQGDGPSQALRTVMTFEACLISCPGGGTTCAAAKKAGIPPCPQ